MTNDYDEDLSQNPFFQAFLQTYVDLFSQCVHEKWTICVPRKDSLPKYAFTLEDFTHHILKPLKLCQELKSREQEYATSEDDRVTDADGSMSSPPSLSRESSCSNLSTAGGSVCSSGTFCTQPSQSPNRNWNFRTLADVHIEYLDNNLYLDTAESSSNNNECRTVQVLFEETFYTTDKSKYKILCIASPLNSKVEECNDEDGHRQLKSPSLWNLSSLRDCIDFLWLNGKLKALENYDAHIKLFLHNHRSLEDLPLPVQRDLVHDLYLKCLTYATKANALSKRLRKKSNMSASSSQSSTSSSTETIDSSHSPLPPVDLTHSLPNFKLATETYVLSGIYRQLINAITSSLSFEDAALNKIIRNLVEIHPQDLDINIIHWDNLPRARQELSRMNLHSSPLAKLCCLKKTMRYLKPEKSLTMFDDTNGMLSADELLPIWVYLLVKTPLDNWIAQLQFLRYFRFSAQDAPDNEYSFYIVTLEASIAHLNSGKISGLPESERDVGIPCEVGVGEYWLRCLFNSLDDGVNTPLAEMFTCIRQGNASKLEQLVSEYEDMRRNQEVVSSLGFDESKLCHPLCNCTECRLLTNPEPEPVLQPVFELKNEEGLTLLHVACIYGRPKIVDYLLAGGAPFDVEDHQGMRPLHYAASKGHQNALLLLLHAGCELEPSDHMLNRPIHFAAMNGHEPCLKALIYYAEHSKQTIGVSSQNYNGDTPLHFASRFGFIGIVQLLVETGASITALNARQTTPIDGAHNVHVLRVLQRSLKRRSLIHTNHEDFVNIDVMKKGDTDGCIMLISEPKEQPPATLNDGSLRKQSFSNRNNKESTTVSIDEDRSRRNSFTSVTGTNGVLTRRKTSAVTTPSFSSPFRPEDSDNLFRRKKDSRSRHKRSLLNGDNVVRESNGENVDKESNGEMTFHISNVIPESPVESEHLRKVPIDNLDHAPHVLAQMASLGVRRRREVKQRGIRKLFTAIAVGDVPLALFYLGIPAEELDRVNDIQPGDVIGGVPCHPLCPCNRCTAKSAGLGLDINVKNSEGVTPLQSAVQHNLHALVKILLNYGADSSFRSVYESKTALEFAKERYYEDIAVTLQMWKIAQTTDSDVPAS